MEATKSRPPKPDDIGYRIFKNASDALAWARDGCGDARSERWPANEDCTVTLGGLEIAKNEAAHQVQRFSLFATQSFFLFRFLHRSVKIGGR